MNCLPSGFRRTGPSCKLCAVKPEFLIYEWDLFQFQIKDAFTAAKISATEAYTQYVEEPMTSQQKRRFDVELELLQLHAKV